MLVSATSMTSQHAAELLSEQELAALDDEVELARYTTFHTAADGRQEACSRLILDGLHCAGCASLIERALLQIAGVHEAQVQVVSRRAQIRWDPLTIKASHLIAAIHKAGYKAYPDTLVAQYAHQSLQTKQTIWRLFAAAFCMMQVMMYATPSYVASIAEITPDILKLLNWASWLLSLPVVLFAATPFYKGAWHALRQKSIGMDVPITLGILVTFIASTVVTFTPIESDSSMLGREVYFDSLTMFVTFLLVGRLLEQRASKKSSEALENIMHRLPQSVERIQSSTDAAIVSEWVSPLRLQVGDEVRIAVGQAFPADGVILAGYTHVDEALLTGESNPLERSQGMRVLAGSYNLTHSVVIRVSSIGTDTRYERIVSLMSQALMEKPSWVRLADRLSTPFLWCVLLLSALSTLVWWHIDPHRAIWVGIAVLIVTCPCALSLATPAAMAAAAGFLARRHVLLQHFEALEALTKVDTVIFDKTGTLTDNCIKLTHSYASERDQQTILQQAATLASYSHHPVAQALVRAAEEKLGGALLSVDWTDIQEVPGAGLQAKNAKGELWQLGSAHWLNITSADIDRLAIPLADQLNVRVWFKGPGGELAAFALDEMLRADAYEAVASLQDMGLQVVLLSGDQQARVDQVATTLNISTTIAEATPETKLKTVAEMQHSGRYVMAVGDGINDAPLLARSNVSFAMGHGAALARARADFIVLNSSPIEIVQSLRLARRSMRIVRQNLVWAALYNLMSVPLAMTGYLPPWLAGLGMAASSCLVVLNALRLSRDRSVKPLKQQTLLVGDRQTVLV